MVQKFDGGKYWQMGMWKILISKNFLQTTYVMTVSQASCFYVQGSEKCLVTVVHFSWTLPECWQYQSNRFVQSVMTQILLYFTFCEISMKMMSLLLILSRVANKMGYQELRAKQQEAILAFMRGRDVFITLPTGCGKLLLFYSPWSFR